MSVRRSLAAAAVVLAAAGAVAGAEGDGGRRAWAGEAALPADGRIGAVELARGIRERPAAFRVLDLRDAAAFDEDHLPLAERVGPGGLAAVEPAGGVTLVVYSASEERAARARAVLAARGHPDVRVLDGGRRAWLAEVMFPLLPADADDATRAAFEEAAALSRYYGGTPRFGARGVGPADVDEALREAVEDAREAGCGW